MEERMKFIHEWQRGEEWSFAELCRRYGVSRNTGYKWKDRYETDGITGLADRTTAPHQHPNQVSQRVTDRLIEARQKHPRWGPKKLRVWLEQKSPKLPWPAASTMGEILKRAGLTAPRRKHPRVPAYPSALQSAEDSNQVWCADYKGYFVCGDGTRCDPLTLSDQFSRYLLRCQVVANLEQKYARALLEGAFREYGMPAAIRTDNGAPFASVALAGLSELAVWWIKLGIRPERIDAGKPQQNGRHERMHRSLKEGTAMPPAKNLRAQQKAFHAFQREYNQERPHQALEMKVPAAVYRPSPRPYPSRLSQPEYETGQLIRTVGSCGRIRWNGERIFITKALANEPIRLEPVEDQWWRLWFSFLPIGWLDEATLRVLELDQGPEPPVEESQSALTTAIESLRQQGI
jgi:transposase InsO family protein